MRFVCLQSSSCTCIGSGAVSMSWAWPVTRKLVRAKSGPGGPLLAAKIGPTPDHFKWSGLPKVVRVYQRAESHSLPSDVCVGPISICSRISVYILIPVYAWQICASMSADNTCRFQRYGKDIKRNTCNSIH